MSAENIQYHQQSRPNIEIQDLSITAAGHEGLTTILSGVDAELSAPRTAILGANGSGKSTLAKAIGGLLKPAGGTIRINGLDTVQDSKKLRRATGYIVANAAAQMIMPTVREDIALTLKGRKLSKTELNRHVDEALEEHELTELADRSCLSLSSGQLQRLALCSVLVGRPQVVIADEPTSMLDARHHRLVSRRLFSMPEETQLLLVTHDLELARRCDDAVLIQEGKLVAHADPDTVIDQYTRWLDKLDAVGELDPDSSGADPTGTVDATGQGNQPDVDGFSRGAAS